MAFLSATSPLSASGAGASAELTDGFSLRIDALEPWLMRVAILPGEGLTVDRTWMVAPEGDVPWRGRDRLSNEGFSGVPVAVEGGVLSAGDLRVEIQAEPLALTISRHIDDGWRMLVSDRPTGAYQWFERAHLFRHFQARDLSERHYGLGDKTGPVDHTGRRLRVLQTDGLGYNAETADPLYKHAPFLIAERPEGDATGLFYDTLAEMALDLGAEHSNYHPHYRHVDTAEKGLICYVIAGPRIRDVVPRLMRLTGRPAFAPRWSLGFAFTTMHHADAPNAQEVMTGFAERCRAEGVPISAIHSGSGYTTRSDGRRYVFTWNETKFPDRKRFFARLGELGFSTCANVKPVLLTEHPDYRQAAAEGWFVRRADGSPAVEMFWGGWGSSLDFTNPATVNWWKDGISKQVLGEGFNAAWNDNNECELWDETATVDGFGKPLPAIDMRPVHALLMTRATWEATLASRPDERPYTISRAGPIGIARYGETWSGDNRTSWHTLRWNLRQGLSMSLSGMPLTGHDIGGFDGPKASPELFLRWVEMMALHPRAVMNSWKPQLDDPTNTPWMHEQVYGKIRQTLALRYRFLPYLYGLAWRAHRTGEPLIVPLFYHFDEAECRVDMDAFMLGPDVLVAPAVTEGATSVSVYLPRSEGGWRDYWDDALHEGGTVATVEAPPGRLPIFVRVGAILPLALAWPDTAPHDASDVELTLFAGDRTDATEREIFFDDGRGWSYRDKDASLVACRAEWDAAAVRLSVHERWSGKGRPALTLAARGLGGRVFEGDRRF
ncbi:MAG: glycoside hydrolase family 31 protein [Rhizobiaceae bacterium]|nr:glycoside hydrolase family 31 protein [Rhizobiaceae bacterium]MCV0408303.1 glycoside hydrolase family 31 protein [Rhizobiaceae bacterium]